MNLRRARKEQARKEKRATGDASAAAHGRTRAEKEAQRAEALRAERRLDDHERE